MPHFRAEMLINTALEQTVAHDAPFITIIDSKRKCSNDQGWLFGCSRCFCIRNLTRSISDTKTTRV